MTVTIEPVNSSFLGIGDGFGNSLIDVLHGSGVDITHQLNILDDALSYVLRQRANLGAVQNRLEFTARSLSISSENLSDSESCIRNADMAREMMAFTKANILSQTGMAMLAQANQLPNNLLELLRQ